MEVRVVTIPVDELRDLIAGAVEQGVRQAGQTSPSSDPLAIHPDRLYTRPEAAALLGFGHRPNTLTEIPEADLPRCKVGPSRGSVRYLGADLVAYAKGLPMPDTAAMVEGARNRLVRSLERPSAVRPIVAGDRSRVR